MKETTARVSLRAKRESDVKDCDEGNGENISSKTDNDLL